MDENQLPRLTIIIVSYNSHYYLKECLESLEKNKPSCSFETVVVDNASSDGSVKMVREDFPMVKLLANVGNKGFATANNQAIKSSNSEYILLINSDCQVYPGSLDKLVDFMDNNKLAGIAGPRIINSDGSIQLSCRRFPSLFNAGMHTILSTLVPGNIFSRKYKLADENHEVPSEVDWVSGSCMIIKREAMFQAGLLDEHYFMYVEDTDLCYQMWKKGWKVFYYPYAEILHHIGGSTKKDRLHSTITMQKSVLYFFTKNYRNNPRILLLPLLIPVLGTRIFLTFMKNLLKLNKV